MRERLLEVLCDPETGADLELKDAIVQDGEIWRGSLRSTDTGKEFAITEGIPRFVEGQNYTSSFGLQWNRFSQVQLDSANGTRYSHDRFEREIGWTSSQVKGQWMLDGGCGCGRFAEVSAELGAEVIALDYSSAVDAAARNLKGRSNVHFVQGNLLCPPIRKGSLAFAYSIGVLQHTPDPSGALGAILTLLCPGGQFGFTIYGRRWYTPLYSKYWLRPITRRMSPQSLLKCVESSMPILFPITDVLFRIPGVSKVAQFVIPVANYVDKDKFTRQQRYDEAVLDTFDMLSPAYDSPMTAEDVDKVFHAAGITKYEYRRRVPVEVVGEIPAG